jgi:hypothetical protein
VRFSDLITLLSHLAGVVVERVSGTWLACGYGLGHEPVARPVHVVAATAAVGASICTPRRPRPPVKTSIRLNLVVAWRESTVFTEAELAQA